MATDLTQEFCALRDTYIEKQFGRLPRRRLRVALGRIVQHGAPHVVRGTGVGTGLQQPLQHLRLIRTGAVRAQQMHQGRAAHRIAGIHLDLSLKQVSQGPDSQFVVIVLACQHKGPFVFPRLRGVGVPSPLFEEIK